MDVARALWAMPKQQKLGEGFRINNVSLCTPPPFFPLWPDFCLHKFSWDDSGDPASPFTSLKHYEACLVEEAWDT